MSASKSSTQRTAAFALGSCCPFSSPHLNEHDPVLTRLDRRYAELLGDVERRWRAFQA